MKTFFCTLLGWLAMIGVTFADEPKEFFIQGATIYDGTGEAGYVGNVHIRGDKIVAVGEVKAPQAAKVIEGSGLIVCPGFIDLHTHSDTGSTSVTTEVGRPIKNYLLQGCTTSVTGNCGSGPVDAAAFFATLEKNGVGTNIIHQAPHNSIRSKAMGNANREPTEEELATMVALVEKAMEDGCVGMATGLIYTPGTYAKTEEIIELAKVVGKHGGLYASHIRNESGSLPDAIAEAIRIGQESGARVHVSHIKATGPAGWGKSVDAIGLIETARSKGQIVSADQYPYIASSTSLGATVVPTRHREGTRKEYLARLNNPELAERIRADIARGLEIRSGGKNIRIARYSPKPEWQGKSLTEIAEMEGKEVVDLVMEMERKSSASVVNFGMKEEEVRLFMTRPWVATASDGRTLVPGDTVPHPRSYGTFPRKIGHYAIDEGVISLEHAIRSASGLPADILLLKDRGYLKPGYFADVVVFDPKTFRDQATFDQPHQYATGVRWVFVNGEPAVADGEHDPKLLAGRVIRRPKPAEKE